MDLIEFVGIELKLLGLFFSATPIILLGATCVIVGSIFVERRVGPNSLPTIRKKFMRIVGREFGPLF